MKEKKVSVSDLRCEAERFIVTGKMPTFVELADAIASSPAAQELLKVRRERQMPLVKN